MRLPNGYRSPEAIWAVEEFDEEDRSLGQFGVFFSVEAAKTCMTQLAAEGHTDLAVIPISVYSRLQDWEHDR